MPLCRALLLAGLIGLTGCTASVPEPVQVAAGNPLPARSEGRFAAAGPGLAGELPAKQATPLPLPSASGAVSTAAAALPLLQAVEQSQDLYGLALQLRARADGGDSQAAWVLGRVQEFCAGYAGDPQRYTLETVHSTDAVRLARGRVQHRCGGFAPVDRLERDSVLLQRRAAAEQGSLAAEASLLGLGQPLFTDALYRRDLVERVIESGDAEAFYALAPAMGQRAAGDAALKHLVAGDADAELAWRVAACQLGKACGPGSMVMDSYCANGGICSSRADDGFVAFVNEALSAGEPRARLHAMIQKLLQARRKAWQ